MNFLASRVTAQDVKKIEIGRHWRLDEVGAGKGEEAFYSGMQACKTGAESLSSS